MPTLSAWLITTFGLAVLLLGPASGQDPCFCLAEHLNRSGFHDQALTEYMRYLYWQPQGELRLQCLAGAVRCRRQLGQIDAALEACRQGASEAGRGDLVSAFLLEAAEIHLAAGHHGSADFNAGQVLTTTPSPCRRIQAQSVRIRAALAGGRHEDCRSAAYRLLDSMLAEDMVTGPQARSWRAQLTNAELASPGRAAALSRMAPGLGQLQVGRADRAIPAVVANGSTGWLLVRSVMTGDVGLAIFSAALLRRFHLGARFDAARVCHEHNIELLHTILDPMLERAEDATTYQCALFGASSSPEPGR